MSPPLCRDKNKNQITKNNKISVIWGGNRKSKLNNKVKIIKIEHNKVHVSMKALVENPWSKKIDKYEIGKKYPAIVTKVQDYGVFAKLEDGLEGLIHSSQLSHTKKNIHSAKSYIFFLILKVSQYYYKP